MTQRFVKVLQEKTQATQPMIKRATNHVEEGMQQTLPKELDQNLIQSAQITVQSIEQKVSQTASRIATAKPQVRSIRPMRPVPTPFPVTGGLGDE